MNFLPVEWLQRGLPRLLRWFEWLRDSWVPMWSSDELAGNAARERLRDAMRHDFANELVVKHCAPHYCHALLTELQRVLTTHTAVDSEHSGTLRAIEAMLGEDCGDTPRQYPAECSSGTDSDGRAAGEELSAGACVDAGRSSGTPGCDDEAGGVLD